MALVPIAKHGNFLHIYDFKVDPNHIDDFIRLFNEFDYSTTIPCTNPPAQVKDGALVPGRGRSDALLADRRMERHRSDTRASARRSWR